MTDDEAATPLPEDEPPKSIESSREPSARGERVATFLRENREAILAEWERAVRRLPAAKNLEKLALRNSIPDLISRIADLVAAGNESPEVRTRFPGPAPELHAIERLKSGYELGEVVAEYATLRSVVFDIWTRREAESRGVTPGDDSDAAALRVLNETLDQAALTAITSFTKERERTLEALDKISSVALAADDLDAFVPELLRVLAEATQAADAAAILLKDGDRLRLRAQFGLDDNTMKDFSVQIGQGFAGRVATEEKPILLRSGKDATLDDDAMARSLGAHALYGVPLKNGNELLGVVYMGSRHAHDFSEGDLALLRALALRASALLVQKELIDSLREADRRKDEFLAMLAHELRNPLAPITTAVALLRLPQTGDVLRERAREVIERQAYQLTRLVDDLLEVSRITRGKIRLEKEPLDARAVVSRAVETVKPLIDAKKQILTVEVPAGPLRILGDPIRLTQVLGNLLSNAAKFTEAAGKITLTLAAEGSLVVFKVRDSGIGIPRAMLKKVFDLFVQVEGSLDRAQGGLGIGLTLVRSLVEMHGGTVSAHSEGLGKGSELVVRLPALAGTREPASAPPDAGQKSTAGLRILVVDDNADQAEVLAQFLLAFGHDVKTACDGVSGLALARTFEPEVVVLDIGLPGMNGYDVARSLRKEHGSKILLVAYSGYGQDEDRRLAKDAGFDHHLLKPMDPNALTRLIASFNRPHGRI